MKREKISEIINNIDTKYVDEASTYTGETGSTGKKLWYKSVAVAACLAILILGGTKIIPMLTKEDSYIFKTESYYEWPWEYKTVGEKYTTVIYEGREYSIKSRNPISDTDILGEASGKGMASGTDSYTDKIYTIPFEVYEINGISAEKLIGAGIDGEYYIYQISQNNTKPATFGELMTLYGLDKNLEFDHFTIYKGFDAQGYYNLKDDSYIWQILSECKPAPIDDSTADAFDRSVRNGSKYLSFTATSEALGVYKRVVYISEDGYFSTNVFDYAYTYLIGTDAAKKIIEYAMNNSTPGKFEAYELTLSGTLKEVTDDYILVDDSILCRNKKDGTVYKIYINDIRLKRCVDIAGINVGDVVWITYNGEISESNEITGAYSMDKGILINGDLAIPE